MGLGCRDTSPSLIWDTVLKAKQRNTTVEVGQIARLQLPTLVSSRLLYSQSAVVPPKSGISPHQTPVLLNTT
jgi:hypothetical protein